MSSRTRTLPEALDEAAKSDAGYVFIRQGKEIYRSYAEIRQAALSVARALRRLGLVPGDLVALALSDAEQFLTALFGASIASLTPASLYPPDARGLDREQYLETTAMALRSSGARAIVVDEALQSGLGEHRQHCPDLDFVLSREGLDIPDGGESFECRSAADDLAFVQFTSGSTSTPKGVAITHRNLTANIDAINGPAGLASSASDSAVSWLPLYHDMGLVGMALAPLYCARPSVLLAPQAFVKRPVEWLRALSRHRATVSFAPTFAYEWCVRRVKDADVADLDLSSWRIAGCGGEPIHAATLGSFAEKFAPAGFRATSFFPSYGLAEHVLAVSFPPRDRGLRTDSNDTVVLVSCGMSLPGHRIHIEDEAGLDLPERSIGEITLEGPSVMRGYYRDEPLTSATIRKGRLRTGDLGYLSDGELYVCGRVKDLIIVNGRNYHAQDLEWALDDLPGLRRGRVAAFGTAADGLSERAIVVAEPSGGSPADELIDSVRRRVAARCGLVLDDVVLVPSGTIERTTSGKLQRFAVKAMFEQGLLGEESRRLPRR
jgi:fatty-acyl-CoA synthase